MGTQTPFHDSLYRLAHIGATVGVQLIQVTGPADGNRYGADPVEFDPDGATRSAGADAVTVTNLAEPADADGTLPAGTPAVAIDVEGRWIIYVRAEACLIFPARVVGSAGQARYHVVQQAAGVSGLADKTGGLAVDATNLAELSLGPGAAVDVGTIVIVTAAAGDRGAVPQYVFDHPAYAKYLD